MKSDTIFWIVLAILGLGALVWMAVDVLKTPTLEFHQLAGSCNRGDEHQASITPGASEIQFTGVIITPIPCVTLEATLQHKRSALIVAIRSTVLDKPCPDCIGRVGYSGRISKLLPGVYTLQILHNGKVVASQEVRVQ